MKIYSYGVGDATRIEAFVDKFTGMKVWRTDPLLMTSPPLTEKESRFRVWSRMFVEDVRSAPTSAMDDLSFQEV